MHRAVARVGRKLARSTHVDLSNLSNFSVVENGSKISATEFVIAVRKKNRPVLKDVEVATDQNESTDSGQLPPSTFRPRGQTGLEQFKPRKKKQDLDDSEQQPSIRLKEKNPVSSAQDLLDLDDSPPDVPGALICADDRELNSSVVARLKSLGADVRIDRLVTGDFRIGERILVERKTVRDFVDSLVDGRLLEQASRLVGAAPRSLLLIEGEGLFESNRVHPHALMGALTTLALDFGIPIVTTKDGAETARFLTVASRREESMLDGLTPQARDRLEAVKPEIWMDPVTQAAAGARELRKSPNQEKFTAMSLLIAIPSVDQDLANRLLNRYGTIAALIWADEDDLRQVEGITETQVREIWRTFRSGERISHR